MNDTEIIENFEKFRKLLLRVSDRRDVLEKFLEKYADRIATAPAHDRNNRLSSAPGGFVRRSLNTLAVARDLSKMPAFAEKEISAESIIIVSLLHDIGRIGDADGDYYLPQTSSWHIERGNLYTYNPDIKRMTHPHRGLCLIQAEGIVLTQDEWMAIVSQSNAYEESKFYIGNESPVMTLLHTSIKISSMLDLCGQENT
jgi:hypothetical protein